MQLYKTFEEDIAHVIDTFRKCIDMNTFTISMNSHRNENRQFLQEYQLTSVKLKKILSMIQPSDFCRTIQNTKAGYEHEQLYIFAPYITVYSVDGIEETLQVYVKFNILDRIHEQRIIIVSFHKCKYKLSYAFR